jgi:hypothetical protein
MAQVYKINGYTLASASTRECSASAKIWRYLTFDKFAWLLEKSKLWHTRLDFLGDPFEGALTNEYVRQRDAGTLPEYLQTGVPADHEKASNLCRIYTSFATCWYESKYESAAMWKLYATEHAGVAIVSTPERMQDSVDLSGCRHGIFSPVEYQDFETDNMLLRPVSKGFGRHAVPGLLKRKAFEHENEMRGLVNYTDYSKVPIDCVLRPSPEAFRAGNPAGIGLKVDLVKMIEGIYVSPLAPCYFIDVVEAIASRHNLSDRIRVSTLLGLPAC